MLQTAKKFQVIFNPAALNSMLKRRMPIWHHLGIQNKTIRNNGQREVCLRQNHKIKDVGNLQDFVAKVQSDNHKPTANCKCDTCKSHRMEGCTSPYMCKEAASKVLNKLPPKWDPRISDINAATEETNDENDNNSNTDTRFNPDLTVQNNLAEGFRVFADPQIIHATPAPEIDAPANQCTITQLCVVGVCRESGNDNAYAGAGGWFPADNTQSFSVKLPPTILTTQAAQVAALIVALEKTQSKDDLIITTNSDYLTSGITKMLPRWEDCGWIGIQNRDLLKKAAVMLRTRDGETHFRKAGEGEQGPKEALLSAKNGCKKPNTTQLTLHIPEGTNPTGAKLSKMTQALLYQGIMELRVCPQRRGTIICLDMTRHGVKEVSGYLPTNEKIWYSLRNKDITRNIRAFLWKCMHNAHRCGEYWLKIPGYEQRAKCAFCDTNESMEHILTECKASGQNTVWRLTQELLTMKGLSQLPAIPTFGQILGCSLARLRNHENKLLKGSSRLYTIVMSESAHLIWRLRCEWKINRGEDPQKIHTKVEVMGRWLSILNTRLKLDCLMTNNVRYGRKALNPEMVERTWNNVLCDERGLPDNWVSGSGVLVGMRMERPPGRNR